MTDADEPVEPALPGPASAESDDEKRARVLRRLAEIVQGPPPDTSGSSGAVAGGGLEQAIAALGLGLSAEDRKQFAGAVEGGPNPVEAAALFQSMLDGFQQWQRGSAGRTSSGDEGDPEPEERIRRKPS